MISAIFFLKEHNLSFKMPCWTFSYDISSRKYHCSKLGEILYFSLLFAILNMKRRFLCKKWPKMMTKSKTTAVIHVKIIFLENSEYFVQICLKPAVLKAFYIFMVSPKWDQVGAKVRPEWSLSGPGVRQKSGKMDPKVGPKLGQWGAKVSTE